MTLPWTPEVKERAKREGRHLLKLQLQGKHADGACFDFSGDISPELATRVKALIAMLVADKAGVSLDPESCPKCGAKDWQVSSINDPLREVVMCSSCGYHEEDNP